MKRIAIIGSPGSGKSTFAKQLAAQTGLPLIHLDFYYHDKQHDYYTNKEEWRTKANGFADADTWIIDGNFGATMAKRLERADTIFYFDMPTYLALLGIIRRWLEGRQSVRSEMPSGWQEKPSISLFWKVLRFRHNYSSGTHQLLAQNRNTTIVVFNNRRQVGKYLSNLS